MATPSTPTNVYVSQADSKVYLSWDLMTDAVSYDIQRGTDGYTFGSIGTTAIPSYLDTTASVGVTYYYKVAAAGTSGTSSFSTAQSIITSPNGVMALGMVRLAAQQRADRVNSKFVTPPEWNRYIVQSYFELYDKLVTVFEDYYVAEPAQFSVNGNSNLYPLPNGTVSFTSSSGTAFVAPQFYKLLGVDCGLSVQGNAWVTVKKFQFIARNRFVFPNVTSTFLGVFNLQYRVIGNNVEFIPTPAGNQVMRLWYIPRLTEPVRDTDLLDGVSGWIEYVIVDAAIKALQKEESDVTELVREKMALSQRIEETAANRDAGQPDTISDTRTWGERWGGYGGPGWDGGFGGF